MLLAAAAINTDDRVYRRREALLARALNPAPVFTLHTCLDPERGDVEAFIADRFLASYGACIQEFMPQLLSMRCLNHFTGVIGIRKAAEEDLFLETYLDLPVEQVLSAKTNAIIERDAIVEVGNLVAGSRGSSQFVFLVAMSALQEAGYRWIVFTATNSLANNLHKLGFPMTLLAPASIDRLSAREAAGWGSYYEAGPQVYAGSLDNAMEIIRRRPLFRQAFAAYRREIRRLSRLICQQ